jgi:hypothetical protein
MDDARFDALKAQRQELAQQQQANISQRRELERQAAEAEAQVTLLASQAIDARNGVTRLKREYEAGLAQEGPLDADIAREQHARDKAKRREEEQLAKEA